LLSLRALGGWVMAQRLKSWKTLPATAEWQETLARLSRRLKVSRTVRLCESVVAEVPTVIGWLRPVILVPVSAFVGLSPQQIEALLAHELAHIRRHDYLVNLLQTAVETLLFYHPAVWWISRQIRTEREHCCDDLAVAACGNVLTYARALAELEELRSSTGAATSQLALAADGGGTGGSLLKRIQRLIETPSSPHQRSSAWLASFVAIAAIFFICIGARTTLFSREADSRQSRTGGATTLQKMLFGQRMFSFVTGQSPTGERAREFQIVVPQIKESVTVTASIEPNKSQNDPDLVLNIEPELADAQDGATPPAPPAPPAPAAPAAPPAPPSGFSYSYRVQDDDDDAPSGSYIDALAELGYRNLSVDQLIEMRNHGVSPSYLKGLKGVGYELPSVETAIRLVDHGVSVGYIKKLAEIGYRNLSFDELIEAVDHGVRPDVIEAYKAAGYGNLTLDQAVRAVDHGVGPSYIKSMSEVGFDKLSLEQLIRLRDHGVSAEYVREIRALGYNSVTAEQFVRLADHGVSPSFLRKARERGFNNLSLDELIKLRDADIL
ncbi:MAG: M56 family metallopeptidase, partial [Acidobacteria bacterium]|nr:M56 family metallopeptidase [Acidobacteriota bacterium]